MSKYLTISFIVIALTAGIGIGYLLSPQYAMNAYEQSKMADFGKADKYVDLRYIKAMIAHHKSAMKLAEQAKSQSKRQEIVTLANAILADEPTAINQLNLWKANWYDDKSQVEASEVPNLGSYDENFDLRFLNALITHHTEGIEMANDILGKSTRNDILTNANGVNVFLSNGVKALTKMRADWYKID